MALFFPFQVEVFLDFYTQCVTVQMLAFDKHFHMALLVSPCCKILKLGSFFQKFYKICSQNVLCPVVIHLTHDTLMGSNHMHIISSYPFSFIFSFVESNMS